MAYCWHRASRWIVGLAVASWLVPLGGTAQEPSLLAKATRIETHAKHNRPNLAETWGEAGIYCHWLSDHQILTFRFGNEPPAPSQVFLYDVVTGLQTPLPRLSRLFEQTHGEPIGSALSPDGNWLLWRGRDDGANVLYGQSMFSVVWCAATLDGLRAARWPYTAIHVQWATDSRHWVERSHEDGMHLAARTFSGQTKPGPPAMPVFMLHSVEAPSVTVSVPLTEDSENSGRGPSCVKPDGTVLFSTAPIYYGLDEMSPPSPSENVQILDFAFPANNTPLHRYWVQLPKGVYVASAEFSPHGKRIMWALATDVGFENIEVWISNVDGSGLRSLGKLSGSTASGIYPDPATLRLRWLPDNRHIGFVYEGALYTAPVD